MTSFENSISIEFFMTVFIKKLKPGIIFNVFQWFLHVFSLNGFFQNKSEKNKKTLTLIQGLQMAYLYRIIAQKYSLEISLNHR